ncbi:MAG TPA: T9SS type A sorting domain-containing protein [Bacteroidales bacterium]|nr:T9SS type A sorting domain-containing protein [Bacteroidales bacterium]
MKKLLFSSLCLLSTLFAFSQISIVRSDVFEANDTIPEIYYGFENDNGCVATQEVMPENLVFGSQSAFPLIMLDSAIYYQPSEIDPNGVFEAANCAYLTKEEYVMYLKITEDKVELIGMQAQMPMSETEMIDVKFDEAVALYNFPCEMGNNNSSHGIAKEKRPLSDFEEMLGNYYGMLAFTFDTVRFYVQVDVISNFDEFGTIKFVGDSIKNGEYEYLREDLLMMTAIDIQLRQKSDGEYVSAGTLPGVPMELPMIDSIFNHNYWTKNNKKPMLTIAYNFDKSSIHSMTFRYEYTSFVNTNIVANLNVYPNPTSKYINFSIDNCEDYELYIFSTDGRLINRSALESNNTLIDISNYHSGVYLYQILGKNNTLIAGGKFIKE